MDTRLDLLKTVGEERKARNSVKESKNSKRLRDEEEAPYLPRHCVQADVVSFANEVNALTPSCSAGGKAKAATGTRCCKTGEHGPC